jgi:ATP synthase protein I
LQQAAGGTGSVVGLKSRAMRTVLRWQVIATGLMAALAGYLAGAHGALSAALGGSVSLAASLGFAGVASLGQADSAGSVVIGALRAEGVKILLIVLLLWLVMATYKNVVVIAFFGTFFVATVLFSAAAFVREDG